MMRDVIAKTAKVSAICFGAVILFVASYVDSKHNSQNNKEIPSVPIDIPEITLDSWSNGARATFLGNENFSEGPHLVSLFSTWCRPCLLQHQLMLDLRDKYPNLSMIAVNVRDKDSDLDSFFESTRNPYNHIYKDPENKLISYFNQRMVPQSIVVYKNEVVFYHKGSIDEQTLEFKLRPIIDTLSNNARIQ
jgi:cytochrome c biogenesis protein CcmG/thiol:disulfide interchange protein DsbE